MCSDGRETERWLIGNFVLRKGETERWVIKFLVLRRGRNCAVSIQCYLLREGRNCAVGDRVFCVKRWEILSGGRYRAVMRKEETERWWI